MTLVAGVDISMPLFQRYAIDRFITPETTDGLPVFTLVYAAVLVAQAAIVVIFSRTSMVLEMSLGRALKRACFVHLQKLSFSYYNQTPVGYILARVMSDTNRISGLVAWSLIDLFWAVAYIIGVFGAMLWLNARLALLVMTVVPVIAVITGLFQSRILRTNRRVRAINSRITGAYNEGITGAKTSKTLVIEEKNDRDFQHLTDQMHSASIRATMLNAMFIPIVLFFGSLAV